MQMAFIFLSGTESYRRYAKWTSAGGVHGQGGLLFSFAVLFPCNSNYHREKLKCFPVLPMADNFEEEYG